MREKPAPGDGRGVDKATGEGRADLWPPDLWGATSSGQSPFHSEHPCGHSSFHSLAPPLPRKALRAFPGPLIARLIKPSPSKGEGAPVRTLGRMRVGWCSEFGFLFDPTPPHPSGLRPSTFPPKGGRFSTSSVAIWRQLPQRGSQEARRVVAPHKEKEEGKVKSE